MAPKTPPQNLLLFGPDERFFKETSREWIQTWGGEDGVLVLPAPDITPARFYSEAGSLPLMCPRQVLRLTHLEAASKELMEAVTDYLNNPSETTALLMEYEGSPPKTARGKKPVFEIFEAVSNRLCKPPSAGSYIQKTCRQEGFTIQPQALDTLLEWSGKEVGRIATALDLLFLYRAEEKTIREEDLFSLLGSGGSPQRWDLQDAFLNRDERRFIQLAAAVTMDPEVEKDPSGTALAFLAMVARQLRALLVLFGLREAGMVDREITPKQLDLSPYPAQKLKAAAGRWNEQDVRRAIGVLFSLDLAIKGWEGPLEPWTLLETRLLELIRNNDR